MTREEAIQALKDLADMNVRYRCDDKWITALNMAIEALQNNGFCPNCGVVVRCKDCRWWNGETKGCKRNPSVEAWQEDDFCKYGKRWSNAID